MEALVLVIVIFFTGCNQNSEENRNDISGNWQYVNNSESRDFSVVLKIENDTLKGTHCFVANMGARIDCNEEDWFTIKCNKVGEQYLGIFNSNYTNKNYNLNIEFSNDTLIWRLDNYSGLFITKDLKFVKE